MAIQCLKNVSQLDSSVIKVKISDHCLNKWKPNIHDLNLIFLDLSAKCTYMFSEKYVFLLDIRLLWDEDLGTPLEEYGLLFIAINGQTFFK